MPNLMQKMFWWAAFAASAATTRASAQDGLGSLLDGPGLAINTQPDQRLPVPIATASKKALVEVKDIFRDDYARATTPQARLALAKQLLSHAEKTETSVERWTLYSESMRLASDAGDVDLCLEAIDNAASHFKIDDDLRIDALAKLAPKATPERLDDLARMAFGLAKKATAAGDTTRSQRCMSLASGFARKAKNTAIVAEIARFQQTVRDEEKAAKERLAATAKLALNPSDPAVCLEVGRYFCFKDNDWARGLPLLAKGTDTDLARLAQLELADGRNDGRLMAVADAWWAWGESQKAGDRAEAMLHAGELYRSLLDKTQGLEQAKIEKRIRQAATEPSSTRGRRVPLSDVPVAEVKDVLYGYFNNGTIDDVPYTCLGQAWPTGISGHVTGQGGKPSSLAYPVPRGAKRLAGKAGVVTPRPAANTTQQPGTPQTFEILLDGRSVWKSQPLSRREETADFDIPLMNAGRVELRVNSTSHANAWAAWLNPEFVF